MATGSGQQKKSEWMLQWNNTVILPQLITVWMQLQRAVVCSGDAQKKMG